MLPISRPTFAAGPFKGADSLDGGYSAAPE